MDVARADTVNAELDRLISRRASQDKPDPAEQFYTRTKLAMRPPKAALADLIPTDEDERRAAEKKAASDMTKYAQFFGPARTPRQVGSRRS